MDRRMFLGTAAAGACSLITPSAWGTPKVSKPQKILVLGGTNFLGPAIVEEALSAGYEVTLLNRGITRPYLFPEVEKLRGDRREGKDGLAALGSSRTWDAVIDVWAADDSIVGASARLLADRAKYYYFISSIAVYRSFAEPWVREDAELRLDEAGYAGEKARAEKLIASLYPDRYGVARCPSIFGPRDPGSTLHYWLRNTHQNLEVLAPGTGNDPVQFVDVRDVARWVLESVQRSLAGEFNTVAPPLRFADFLDVCLKTTGSSANLSWLSKDFLYSQNVEAFTQLPLWVPVEEDPGFFQISAAKARKAGFRTRTPGETLAAAWRWYQSAFFSDVVFPHNGWGMSWEKQAQLLERWQAA